MKNKQQVRVAAQVMNALHEAYQEEIRAVVGKKTVSLEEMARLSPEKFADLIDSLEGSVACQSASVSMEWMLGVKSDATFEMNEKIQELSEKFAELN